MKEFLKLYLIIVSIFSFIILFLLISLGVSYYYLEGFGVIIICFIYGTLAITIDIFWTLRNRKIKEK